MRPLAHTSRDVWVAVGAGGQVTRALRGAVAWQLGAARREGRREAEEHAGGTRGEIHREPEESLARERDAAAVADRVPGQAADMRGDPGVTGSAARRPPVREICHQPGAAPEQARLCVIRRAGGGLDALRRPLESGVRAVSEKVIDDEPDTSTAAVEVG